MLHGQPDVCAQVDGKRGRIDGPSADLVAEMAKEQWCNGLHDLVDGTVRLISPGER